MYDPNYQNAAMPPVVSKLASGLPPAKDECKTPADFLRKFSSQPRLVPLSKLVVSPHNRKGKSLNGSQVMRLMTRWQNGSKGGGEDFQQYRYKIARVHESDPEDPQAGTRHTNLMASRDERIRPVSDDSKDGPLNLFSKCHCWSALWGTVGRSIKPNLAHDAGVMEPPLDQPDFQFAEKEGMWCEVIPASAIKQYPDIFIELMRSENFDAACSLPEDEISLLTDIFEKLTKGVDKKLGETLYDAIQREILNTATWGDFNAKDVECRYNLAKVLGIAHMDFLSAFCTRFVDFKRITVPNKCVQALTRIQAGCPWLKVCLYTDNYMTPDAACSQRVSGGKGIAENWKAADIDDIVSHFPQDELKAMEDLVSHLIGRYSPTALPSVSTDIVFQVQCKICFKVGALMRDKKRRIDWRTNMIEIEYSGRKRLPAHVLPEPILADTRPPPKETEKAVNKHKETPQIDEAPALNFDAKGDMQEDHASKARDKGLTVGSSCITIRPARSISKNRVGIITAFGNGKQDPLVRFLLSGDEPEVEVQFPLASLAKHTMPEKDQTTNKGHKRKAEDDGGLQPDVSGGIDWQVQNESSIEACVKHSLLALNTQLAIRASPTHEQVFVSGEPRVLVARKVLEPLELIFVPLSAKLETLKTDDGLPPGCDITMSTTGSRPVAFSRVCNAACHGLEVGTCLHIAPVEFLMASSKVARTFAGGCAELELIASGEVKFDMCRYTTSDDNLKAKTGKAHKIPAVSATFTYWTNKATIPAGSALSLPEAVCGEDIL
jgi:hypothetical protein